MKRRRGPIIALAITACSCSTFSEAPAGDAGASPDASLDGGSDAASGTAFCASQTKPHSLCDDFDVGELGYQWSEVAKTGGGLLDLVPSERNASKMMLARSSASTNGQAWAYLNKDLGDKASGMTYAFDMRILGRGTSYAEAGGFLVKDGAKRWGVVVLVEPNGALAINEADDTKQIKRHSFGKTPVPGTWARFQIDVDLPTNHLRVLVDGEVSIDEAIAPSNTAGTRFLEFGLDYVREDGWSLAFDNLTCDLR